MNNGAKKKRGFSRAFSLTCAIFRILFPSRHDEIVLTHVYCAYFTVGYYFFAACEAKNFEKKSVWKSIALFQYGWLCAPGRTV